MEKYHFVFLFFIFSIFLNACSFLSPQKEANQFYLKAPYHFIDFTKKTNYTGTLLWQEENNQKQIFILGPLNFPLAKITQNNQHICVQQGKKNLCDEAIPKHLKPIVLLFEPSFKKILKGEKEKISFFEENNIQISYSNHHYSRIRFFKEKEWQLDLIIANLEF